MTTLNIVGLDQSDSDDLNPSDNGTYDHLGSNGGTEQMYRALYERMPKDLIDKFNIICSRVRAVDESKRNILWLHDTWDDPESQHLKEEKSLARFEKLVFVSHYQQSLYNVGLNVPYSKGIVLQNAIVPIEAHEKPKGSTINLIYHTTPHRGLELLVPVVDHLVNKGVDLHLDVYSSFKIYGWEARDEPYKPLFAKCLKHPNITYHGYQPNDVIRKALKKAHIYSYPNIWPETSGISVIEAMSAGCSVVCPNFAALPETCANFGVMYNWSESTNEHANIFAGVLNMVLKDFWEESNQNKLRFQKMYFDNFYNWSLRENQWKAFLSSLTATK